MYLLLKIHNFSNIQDQDQKRELCCYISQILTYHESEIINTHLIVSLAFIKLICLS